MAEAQPQLLAARLDTFEIHRTVREIEDQVQLASSPRPMQPTSNPLELGGVDRQRGRRVRNLDAAQAQDETRIRTTEANHVVGAGSEASIGMDRDEGRGRRPLPIDLDDPVRGTQWR